MTNLKIELKGNKRVYFASDFHLGLSSLSRQEEIDRENKIIKWLSAIEHHSQAIFLVGDIFDFWFEYKHAIPKGFVRFLGKIAHLTDHGIPVYFFTGNHDMWMFRYFKEEIGVEIFDKPIELIVNDTNMLIGHGDGLGPGDTMYKIQKKVFTNKMMQWLFRWLHPDLGIGLAKKWSNSSRLRKAGHDEEFMGEKEFLVQYCKQKESENHHDYYIFGHRHLPLEININGKSKYINLGEWVNNFTYGEFDGNSFILKKFEDNS